MMDLELQLSDGVVRTRRRLTPEYSRTVASGTAVAMYRDVVRQAQLAELRGVGLRITPDRIHAFVTWLDSLDD